VTTANTEPLPLRAQLHFVGEQRPRALTVALMWCPTYSSGTSRKSFCIRCGAQDISPRMSEPVTESASRPMNPVRFFLTDTSSATPPFLTGLLLCSGAFKRRKN